MSELLGNLFQTEPPSSSSSSSSASVSNFSATSTLQRILMGGSATNSGGGGNSAKFVPFVAPTQPPSMVVPTPTAPMAFLSTLLQQPLNTHYSHHSHSNHHHSSLLLTNLIQQQGQTNNISNNRDDHDVVTTTNSLGGTKNQSNAKNRRGISTGNQHHHHHHHGGSHSRHYSSVMTPGSGGGGSLALPPASAMLLAQAHQNDSHDSLSAEMPLLSSYLKSKGTIKPPGSGGNLSQSVSASSSWITRPSAVVATNNNNHQIQSDVHHQHTKTDDHDSVRFGRVPKREKAKILAAMQKVNAHSLEKALSVVLEDEQNLMQSIIKAHEETCDYTKEKVAPLLDAARSRPIYAQCPQMTCPLNPLPPSADQNGAGSRLMEDFSERFSPAIHGVVEFAKRIPGFQMLSQEDQVTLLKAGVFEVLLVRLACMFDSQTNSMVCLNGLSLRRDSLHSASNARFLLDSMFEFAERLNSLRLTDHEIGLFCAVVVIAPDRPGIRNIDLVQKINKRLEEILQKAIAGNRHHDHQQLNLFLELTKKIPDLRTLNALHSEKLLGKSFGANMDTTPVNSSTANATTIVVTPASSAVANNSIGNVPNVQQQPDSQSESPDRWSSSSSSSLIMGHFSPNSINGDASDNCRRSVSPQSVHHDSWNNDSKDGLGSPRSMSSGVSSDDSGVLSRKGSISLTAPSPRMAAYMVANNTGLVAVSGSVAQQQQQPPAAHHNHHYHHHHQSSKIRVDSPTDSGIESGKEHGSASTPTTSVCSSPQSAIDDSSHHNHTTQPPRVVVNSSDTEMMAVDKQESIDDMPVLKRALQAPPLVNTNKLMDEAYRHHKKFRAAAHRRDTDPHSPTTTTNTNGHQQTLSSSSSSSSGGVIVSSQSKHMQSSSSLAGSHSTLLKTLEQPSRYMNEQQLKRTDLIHNIIMNTEAVTAPGQVAPVIKESAGQFGQASVSEQQPQYYAVKPEPSAVMPQQAAAQQVTVVYAPGFYQIPATTTSLGGGCPFRGGQQPQYHQQQQFRTSPTPMYHHPHHHLPEAAPHHSPSSHHHHHHQSQSSPLLVIGSSPAGSTSPSASSSSTAAAAPAHSPRPPYQTPYSHLQRCLTATVAPTGSGAATPASAASDGIMMDSQFDCQPLNLSKKSSSPPLSIKSETTTSTPAAVVVSLSSSSATNSTTTTNSTSNMMVQSPGSNGTASSTTTNAGLISSSSSSNSSTSTTTTTGISIKIEVDQNA